MPPGVADKTTHSTERVDSARQFVYTDLPLALKEVNPSIKVTSKPQYFRESIFVAQLPYDITIFTRRSSVTFNHADPGGLHAFERPAVGMRIRLSTFGELSGP